MRGQLSHPLLRRRLAWYAFASSRSRRGFPLQGLLSPGLPLALVNLALGLQLEPLQPPWVLQGQALPPAGPQLLDHWIPEFLFKVSYQRNYVLLLRHRDTLLQRVPFLLGALLESFLLDRLELPVELGSRMLVQRRMRLKQVFDLALNLPFGWVFEFHVLGRVQGRAVGLVEEFHFLEESRTRRQGEVGNKEALRRLVDHRTQALIAIEELGWRGILWRIVVPWLHRFSFF